jgi:hypothetical protein
MNALRLSLCVIALLLPHTVLAAECTRAQAIAAEETASTLKSWNALHSAFVSYHHCDDGAIAEGFSESVSKLLSEQWGALLQLSKLATNDRPFLKFVLSHIDETVPADRLKEIGKHAKQNCPKYERKLCESIFLRAAMSQDNLSLDSTATRQSARR